MSDFNTSVKLPLKNGYIPVITGMAFILTALLLFIAPLSGIPLRGILISSPLILSGILTIIFTNRNRKAIEGWPWYIIFGILILAAGIFLLQYNDESLTFMLGIVILFRSGIFIGISVELKKCEHPNWSHITIVSVFSIAGAFMLINNFASGSSVTTEIVISYVFMGLASVLLAKEFRKVNRFHRILRKLSRH